MYHRAYKSVHEDQIGFQKYKIHSDIKKQKKGERSDEEREGTVEKRRVDGGPRDGARQRNQEKRVLIGRRDSAR